MTAFCSPPCGPRLGRCRDATAKLKKQILLDCSPQEGNFDREVNPTGDNSQTTPRPNNGCCELVKVAKSRDLGRATRRATAESTRLYVRRGKTTTSRHKSRTSPAAWSTTSSLLRLTILNRSGALYVGADDGEGSWPSCSLQNCGCELVDDGDGVRWACRRGNLNYPTVICPWRT